VEAGFAAVYGYEYLLEHGVIMGAVVFNGETNAFFVVYNRLLYHFFTLFER